MKNYVLKKKYTKKQTLLIKNVPIKKKMVDINLFIVLSNFSQVFVSWAGS